MHLLRLLVSILTLAVTIQTVAQSPEPPRNLAADYFIPPPELDLQLKALLADAQSGNRDALLATFKKMRIPSSEGWFAQVFGPANQARLSPAYQSIVDPEDLFLAQRLSTIAPREGKLFTIRVPDVAVTGEPHSTSAIRLALRQPVIFYAVSFAWSGEGNSLNKVSLGFFTLINEQFRRLPGGLSWLLQPTPDALPPVPLTTAMRMLISDPPFAVALKVAATVPPPAPNPPPPPLLTRPASPIAQENAPSVVCDLTDIHNDILSLPAPCEATKLLSSVAPSYPPLARQTRISGTVRLHVIVAKDGSIKTIEVVSGHPLLLQSAINAVRQWRYSPTLFSGTPIEVDTIVDVVFALNQ